MAVKKQSKASSQTLAKKKTTFRFKWWMAAILIVVIAVTGLIILRFSRASGGTHYLQNSFGGHNYGAAVMKDFTGEHYFWCGIYQYVGKDGKPVGEEVVYYQHLDYATGQYSTAYPTLLGSDTNRSAGWENGSHMCDPTIVSGNFAYAGTNYKYALYYDSDPDHSSHNTKIGVAFTNSLSGDGNNPTKWKFVDHPVICEYGSKKDTYGVGTTSALIDPNDSSKVKMFFYDTSQSGPVPPNGRIPDVYVVDGSNGYDFGWNANCVKRSTATNAYIRASSDDASRKNQFSAQAVNTNNVISPGGDFAYDKENNWYYMVSGDSTSGRNPAKDGVTGFPEAYQLIVARIKPEALTDTSKGGWQLLGHINSDTTKSYLNFNAALLRNGSGYLDGVTGMKDGVRKLDIWNSQIVTDAVVNNPVSANSDTGLQTAELNNTKIALIHWEPGRIALNRYSNPQTEHITTSGVKPKADYKYDNQTYYVLPGSVGVGWEPIYSCVTTGLYDYFLSTNVNCDGFLQLGIVGYSFRGQDAPKLAGKWVKLYRCWNYPGPNGLGENFMTISETCEGAGKPVDSSYGWVSLNSGNSAFK